MERTGSRGSKRTNFRRISVISLLSLRVPRSPRRVFSQREMGPLLYDTRKVPLELEDGGKKARGENARWCSVRRREKEGKQKHHLSKPL